MSVTNEELRVKLLDARKAETELRSVRRELEHTTGATEKQRKESQKSAEHAGIFSRTAGGLKSALGYSAGLIGLGAVGYGLKDVVQGGMQAQEQQVLLQNALKQTGQTGGKHLGELNTEIERSSAHGGFAPVEETEGLAQLVRLTKSSTKAISLNREAIALARGGHMDYGRALSMTERIQTGQVGRLQKFLGIIQPVKYYVEQLSKAEKKRNPEAVKHAELLDKEATAQEANRRVLERYGGAVQAYGNTAAGSVSNAKNAIKLLEENLGKDLLPTITEVAKGLSSVLVEIEEGHGVWGKLGEDASTVGKDFKTVWEWVEKSKTAVDGLVGVLGFLAAAWGVEKVIAFYNAIKSLTLVSTITKMVGGLGPAVARSAEEVGGEAGAFEVAGGVLGSALAAGLGVALAAGIAYELVKHRKEIQEDLEAELGIKELKHKYVNVGPKYTKPQAEYAHKFEIENQREERRDTKYAHDPSLITPDIWAHLDLIQRHSVETQAKEFHVHFTIPVELDGKQIAHITGDHAIRDPKVARKFAEGTTKHVLAKKARE